MQQKRASGYPRGMNAVLITRHGDPAALEVREIDKALIAVPAAAGAFGGVGIFAVLLAKALGARVIGICIGADQRMR